MNSGVLTGIIVAVAVIGGVILLVVFINMIARYADRKIPAELREQWVFECKKCGAVRNVSELGMIRIGARSRGKRVLRKCPACGVRSWLHIRHRP